MSPASYRAAPPRGTRLNFSMGSGTRRPRLPPAPAGREDESMPADTTAPVRRETAAERDDRNWSEVLQELRVLQTGTQILTGFLLALAFQPAFADLDAGKKIFYLVLVVLAALSSIVALAPVSVHRMLFRRHAKRHVVEYGHVALITALVTASLL